MEARFVNWAQRYDGGVQKPSVRLFNPFRPNEKMQEINIEKLLAMDPLEAAKNLSEVLDNYASLIAYDSRTQIQQSIKHILDL